MKFAFIVKHRHVWPVSWLCEALDVSRSGFHAWLRRGPSTREAADKGLTAEIRLSFVGSARTYGARRVWRDVLAEGFSCGLHKVERLMRMKALRARPRRRGFPRDDGARSPSVAPNLSIGNSPPSYRTRGGSRTSHISGRPRAGSMLRR
jgi:putative transposase